MTNDGVHYAHPKDDGHLSATPTTSSTGPRAGSTPVATSSRSAVRATTGLTSQALPAPGDLSSSRSLLWRRLAHAFGRHDSVPFMWWDPVNEVTVWSPLRLCAICRKRVMPQ